MKIIDENRQHDDHPEHDAALCRLAKAWNGVHRTLATQPQGTLTTPLPFKRTIFFLAGDHCYAVEGLHVPVRELTDDMIRQAFRFEWIDGAGSDDLNELATLMETWLERPAFVYLRSGSTEDLLGRASAA